MLSNKINIPLLCILCGTFLQVALMVFCYFRPTTPEALIISVNGGATALYGTGAGVASPNRRRNDNDDNDDNAL